MHAEPPAPAGNRGRGLAGAGAQQSGRPHPRRRAGRGGSPARRRGHRPAPPTRRSGDCHCGSRSTTARSWPWISATSILLDAASQRSASWPRATSSRKPGSTARSPTWRSPTAVLTRLAHFCAGHCRCSASTTPSRAWSSWSTAWRPWRCPLGRLPEAAVLVGAADRAMSDTGADPGTCRRAAATASRRCGPRPDASGRTLHSHRGRRWARTSTRRSTWPPSGCCCPQTRLTSRPPRGRAAGRAGFSDLAAWRRTAGSSSSSRPRTTSTCSVSPTAPRVRSAWTRTRGSSPVDRQLGRTRAGLAQLALGRDLQAHLGRPPVLVVEPRDDGRRGRVVPDVEQPARSPRADPVVLPLRGVEDRRLLVEDHPREVGHRVGMVVAVGPFEEVDAQVDRRPHAEVVGELADQLADGGLEVPRHAVNRSRREHGTAYRHPVTWTPYADLDDLLAELLDHWHRILGDDLAGAWIQGSFALGAGDQQSDCDWIVATQPPVDRRAGRPALREVHDEIPTRDGHWPHDIEGSYAPMAELGSVDHLGREWLFNDHGHRTLVWDDHCNRGYTRWILREHGVALRPGRGRSWSLSPRLLRAEARAAIPTLSPTWRRGWTSTPSRAASGTPSSRHRASSTRSRRPRSQQARRTGVGAAHARPAVAAAAGPGPRRAEPGWEPGTGAPRAVQPSDAPRPPKPAAERTAVAGTTSLRP